MPLGLVQRELVRAPVELVAAVLDAVRPRDEQLAAAGGTELAGAVAVEDRPLADGVRPQARADAHDDGPLLAERELDLFARRIHRRSFRSATAAGFTRIGRCCRDDGFLACGLL